jgi:16S rRNA (uracil1498-N3)-methyltransferase
LTTLIVIPLPGVGEKARLSPEEAAHARARRLRAGAPVALVDGSGRRARGVVTRLGKDEAEVSVEELLEAEAPGVPIALSVAGLRAERLAWIAEKATELSAARLTIVETSRTQSFRASEQARKRLERVVREAAKQCGSARWPALHGPVSLEEALVEDASTQRYILDFSGEVFPATLPPRSVSLLVGPEGGWTDAERTMAAARGWTPAALPAGRLRAETAAVCGLILARAALAHRS